MKPILFKAEMVRAILDGRKSVARRTVKYTASAVYGAACVNGLWNERYTPEKPPESLIEWYIKHIAKPPYHPGDILYVRETWRLFEGPFDEHEYYYLADGTGKNPFTWRPSIHMPKEAARLFLRVTDVRVERLQDITGEEALKEGAVSKRPYFMYETVGRLEAFAKKKFEEMWDSTIKKADLSRYGWDANPRVWVIEFERIGKEGAMKEVTGK